MTPTSPMTYKDFIYQVEEAMLPDSPLRVASEGNSLLFSGADKANSDFKFEDMEVGKIYVIWAPLRSGADKSETQLWFLTPHTLHNEHDYSVYWCYYLNPKGRMIENSGSVRNWLLYGYKCSSWSGVVWGGGKRWKVLENNLFNAFMNWINENPFEVKQ